MKLKKEMKYETRRIIAAMIPPLFLIFILYALRIVESGMDWDLVSWGIYPLQKKGSLGILTSPLVHSSFQHLFANTIPLLFLSWCLFYFYRGIAPYIFLILWVGCGILTFIIGQPGWHIGASGIIYGLAFFLFFSGILRKHTPLIAISLLVTFLYGGLIWNMIPYFADQNTSWEGHLSGALIGTICAILFMKHGPQRPRTFEDEEQKDEQEEHNWNNHSYPTDHFGDIRHEKFHGNSSKDYPEEFTDHIDPPSSQ